MSSEDFSYLMPGHSEKHRRAPNWTDGEMKALLYVWDEHHNELKMSKRNAKVYEKMSQRFFQLTGEQRFKEEIKMKITNMSFQYRRLKSTIAENGEMPDWPYFKSIEKILSKPLENGRVNSVEFVASTAGPSTSSQSTDNLVAPSEEGMMGFLPEYTGSSDEMEIKQELESLSSDSDNTQGSSSRPISAKKRHANKHLSMKRKKLRVMQAMLQQQRRSSRAIEETCREVRRAMHQQNLLQVQCLQLQERMMNLLEKLIQPPSATSWRQSGNQDPGNP
ncbi:myb/SANT-like DNA-binding domain-containing protein 1 [Paralichthys olivaceus]|uniref:myb/SANT-like DNA-binding domain-containing protein 1 n=1 Tax=Paralichthys olivaceus TaxID=8255 RepID=UPI00097DDDFF|nr:PREDICTED: myb/SANT-like DNA-binding domain-containing protein 1 [Paralichthys olivaceus]